MIRVEPTTPSVVVRYPSRERFCSAITQGLGGAAGELFVPTVAPDVMGLSLGTPVRLEVHFEHDSGRVFRVLGKVSAKHVRRIDPGLSVSFAPHDREASALLLNYALGDEVPYRVRARRVSLALPVTCSGGPVATTASLEDLSETGAFVQTESTPALGTFFKVRMRRRWSWPLTLDAQVMWQRNRPGLHKGVGVRFVFQSPAQRSRLQRFMQAVSPGAATETFV